jgi:hypothetical protein
LDERQLHSSPVIKAEEFDFESVSGKKKEKFPRINAFLSRSERLNFVDTPQGAQALICVSVVYFSVYLF